METKLENYEKMSTLTLSQLLLKNWKVHLLVYFLSVFLIAVIMKLVLFWINSTLEEILITSMSLSFITLIFYILNEKNFLIDSSKLVYPEFIMTKRKRKITVNEKSFYVRVSDYDVSMCKYYASTSTFYILYTYLNIIKYLIIFLTFMYVMPPLLIMSTIFYTFRHHMVLSGTGVVDFPTNARALEFYINNLASNDIGFVFLTLLLMYLLKIAIFSNKDVFDVEVDTRLYYAFSKMHCAETAKTLKFNKINYPNHEV